MKNSVKHKTMTAVILLTGQKECWINLLVC